MGVAPDSVILLAHDERRLGVNLQARKAVRDVDAESLERARPGDVVQLILSGLQLDENGDLLSTLRGFSQRAHDLRVARSAIQRHLDRQHARVGGSGQEKMLH